MDRKKMNLARAKKKLRYFRAEEKSPYAFKIKDVFTLHDIDNIFDDLDSPSESATPQRSPLLKITGLIEPESARRSPELKPLSPFEEPEIFPAENDIQDHLLNDKGSPFKVIAPIKTSSPIDIPTVGSEAGNAQWTDHSSLLFGGEDEEPIKGVLRPPPSNHGSRSPKKLLQGVTRLESTLPDVESQTLTAPQTAPQTAETGEELQIHRSPLPAVLQGSCSNPLVQEQRKDPGQVEKVDTVKKTSFQQKLRNALQPKSSCFRKQESQKRLVRALSPVELDDDFMILEDHAPILFTIPKKPESSQKGKMAPEVPKHNSTEAFEVEQVTVKPTDDAELCEGDLHVHQLSAVKKDGKTCITTETVAQTAVGESEECLGLDEVAVSEHICPTSETNQEADLPDIGKRRTKSKAKPDQFGKKDKRDHVQTKTPRQNSSSKSKKSAKLTSDASTREEEPESNVKEKRHTARSAVKPGGPVAASSGSAQPSKKSKSRTTVKVKKLPEDPENGLHNPVESPQTLNIKQPHDFNSSTAGKEATKQPTMKQAALEGLTKVRKEKSKNSQNKECTAPKTDLSAEGPVTGKRKRRPPGEWWLTQEQETHLSLQDLKSHNKIKRKETSSRPADCAKECFFRPLVEELQHTMTGEKVSKKGKLCGDEVKSRSKGRQRNPKITRRKGKPKTVAANQREPPTLATPSPVVGEEMEVCEALGQLTPLRQRSLTPGNKMFDIIYTRDSQSVSAQKCCPSPVCGPEAISEKRRRKASDTWREVLPSPRSPDCSDPPLICSPARPTRQKAPPHGASVGSAQSMAVRAQKMNKRSMVNTTFSSTLASGKAETSTARKLGRKGCRNLLHSLEEQSERSSKNVHSDGPQQMSGNATFDVCVSGITMKPAPGRKKMDARLSAGSRVSDHDFGFKSGPSSEVDLERFREMEDGDLPASRRIVPMRHVPRVRADCDLCGPPLRPIVLEPEDWDNLCVWLMHLWPSAKNGRVINPDDFHWYSYGGRGMGHMVDLQNNTFSNGKILLGSFMKKPPHVDLNAVTVFNVVSSCVRVEIEGNKAVYNSGQTFVTPCGQSYSIQNVCCEPAVLWYNRMLPNHSRH